MTAMETATEQALYREVKRTLLVAGLFILLIVGGVFVWGSFAEISSAVVAQGTIVVQGNTKKVQHREGGIVKDILVNEGDLVESGDILIRLDDTRTQANLAIVTKQLVELRAQAARLLAERDGRSNISFPQQTETPFDASELADIHNGHIQLMESRRKSLEGRKNQLKEQIKQLNSQISGLMVQRDAKADEIRFVQQTIAANETLIEKKLVTQSYLNEMKREKAELEGDYGGFVSQLAQIRQAVSEKELQLLQIADDAQAGILEEYQTVRSKITQLEEQEISARDQLKHILIRAPQTGVVHQLAIHTIGAVITPGETVMMIVPREDRLIVQAKVNPSEIDRLSPDQEARLRFPAFDRRTTPEIKAHLDVISADRITDQMSGQAYYEVLLRFSDEELGKLEGKTLVPGMPVEVYLQTGYRSVLSYLVKPMVDQIEHALKER
ncbi:HlyD family type I secretion periplasmic adaptor subunit [Cohaesibacter haloalkalitolerans]|uniref:HlyD family type I secretion periplasmic adaptor subunit n=1 Tax=Cohaesibacter haloalkalitolerans TaxID=1162980 RepID=UPI0019697693|nr:HlyD family type I secretion periplasmic adaptor subunit [Cohaesibacter haloalkalitolerans]